MSNHSYPSFYGKTLITFIVAASVVGLFLVGSANYVLESTNDMEFCISCHSMQTNYEEYKETIHFKNASGVQATCADCHVPKPLGPKLLAKLLAAKDVMHEILGTIDSKEKFEKHRWSMANAVWQKMKANDSRECRTCHTTAAMDFSEQDKTAAKKHKKATENGKTCIDCHRGIAHEEPDEPDEEMH